MALVAPGGVFAVVVFGVPMRRNKGWLPQILIGTAIAAVVNLPVAVLIWLMIIPMLLKVDFSAMGQLRQHFRGIPVDTVAGEQPDTIGRHQRRREFVGVRARSHRVAAWFHADQDPRVSDVAAQAFQRQSDGGRVVREIAVNANATALVNQLHSALDARVGFQGPNRCRWFDARGNGSRHGRAGARS